MTKDQEAYLAYRKAKGYIPQMAEADAVLAHYGVPGMKWGQRQWQNADGSYTEAGKHRYGWGYGRQNTGTAKTAGGTRRMTETSANRVQRSAGQPRLQRTSAVRTQQPRPRQPSQQEIEARKARTRRILGIAAGVGVAAALSYGAYRGSTKLRDNMRTTIGKSFNTDSRNVHTLNSKYWDASDRKKYAELSAQRRDFVVNNFTRRDAVAAKFTEKTGLRVNVPQSRKRVLAERRSANSYSNFIRDAEKRGHMNKSIHDARADLRAAQKKLTTYQNTEHIGTSKQYEALWTQRHQESVEAARKRLNNLLLQRRAG